MATPNDDLQKQRDLLEEILAISRQNNDEIRDEISNTNLTTDQKRTILKLLRDTNKEIGKAASLSSFVTDQLREEKQITQDLNKANDLKNKLANEISQAQQTGNIILENTLKNQQDQVKELINSLENEKKVSDEVNESFGIAGQALKSLNKLTGGQIKGLDDILKRSSKQLGDLSLQGKLQGGINGALKGGGILAKNMAQELFKGKNIYLMLLKAAIEGSNQINKFQKEFGIGYGKAVALRNEFTLMAAKSGDLFVNSKKLQEAFFELKGAVGFVFDTSSRASETFLNLSKRLGFSAQEAGNLALLTRLQSKDTEAVTSNLFKAADASAKMYGTTATANDILKSAATASKGLQAALSAAPGALVKAAAAAKAFGVELSALEATQKSLLNFEQSIGAELEAELLTGRQLNLEKARLAALNNDLATVGEELKNQQIDLASFSSMNAIQQEKIAESIGMSRDSLGDALLKQELQSKTLDEINAKFGKQTYEQAKALSAQDKFNALTEKLMSLVGDIGVVLAPILDLAVSLLQILSPIIQLIGGLVGLIGKGMSSIVEGLGIDELGRSIEGGFNNITSVNDAVIDPSGNIISTAPDDYLIATKDPSSLGSIGESTIKETTIKNTSTIENNMTGGGITDEQIGKLISGINSKKVVFDSFTSSGPQAFVETERRRPSNLFF